MNDTTYYTIPSANDYLRVIWIDSAKASGNDSIFHFYPSIRFGNTISNCLDTLGPTWLGKNFIKKQNGNELFFNRWLDTIVLKPTAVLSATWLLHTDTANNEFRATITMLDTMTIDGQLDSIKEVTIEVYNNNVAVTTHVHHNKKLILSKAHGFVECLEWYGFPIAQVGTTSLFRNYNETHVRFNDNGILKSGDTSIDLSWKYQVGNIWQRERIKARFVNPSIYENIITITEDSVLNVQITSPNSRNVTLRSKTFMKFVKQGHVDSFTYHDTTWTVTITNSPSPASLILPEFNNNLYNMPFNSPVRYYGKIQCQRPKILTETNGCEGYEISSCPRVIGSVSTCVIENNEHWYGFGETELSYYFPGSVGGAIPPYDYYLKFARINNCEVGNQFSIWPLSISNSKLSIQVDIYPNPTNDIIHFKTKDKTRVKSVSLFSLQGKEVSNCENCKNCKKLNTTSIENGLYILNIETDKGTIRKKIVVKH